MFVIGTAGHVDHGKSTLVKALTGIDPDRLREEKAREMTIDLGFAWLSLPGLDDDEDVGVVDVPGHRDFIENMLAGVGGIDLALLVIAADEGIMPQTQEHLAILDLLAVRSGVVALTKTDLVDDPDWIELVELEVAEALEGTALAGAEIIPVSAREGEGLAELKRVIVDKLNRVDARPDNGRPRLPIDRIFTISGFGTIVTGTLLDGQLKLGDTVEILPKEKRGRIRGLQTHKTKRDVALPGSRVAVNITGVEKSELTRGDVLALEGILRPTILIDTLYKQLDDADGSLKHNAKVKLFTGSAEVLARVRVLGQEEILPGGEGWVQFALESPLAVLRNDRFIVRRPSPPATIGGGRILDPYPGRQHRRFRQEVLDRLKTIEHGTPGELLLQKLIREEPANVNKFKRRSGLEAADFDVALAEILDTEAAVLIDNQLLSAVKLQRYVSETSTMVADFHEQHPLRIGISLEEVRSRLQIPAALMAAVVERTGLIQDEGRLKVEGHEVVFEPALQQKIDQTLSALDKAGIQTPLIKEIKSDIGEDVYFAMVDLGRLVPLNDDVFYTAEAYTRFKAELIQLIRDKGSITAGDVRDHWSTSRKYAIAFLEHLDQLKVTRREGDSRKLI